LKGVREIAGKRRFLHWELEFADLFQERGGFDLILGNPPWIRIEWDEGGVLGDKEPLYILRKLSAPRMRQLREEALLKHPDLRDSYLDEYVEFEGTQKYLNAKQNYPLLQGSASNSYKCFLTQAWTIASPIGVHGFLHPEGVYDDPNGGALRSVSYARLRYHLQFTNELQLFAEIDHHNAYSVNVSGRLLATPKFFHVSNLYAPGTLDTCFDHDGSGVCGGIKDKTGDWNITGHRDRVIEVDEQTLALFARLYDEADTPALQARLPSLHARELVGVLRKFADYPKRLSDLEGQYFSTQMWNETMSVDDGTIRRETRFPVSVGEWILSGPHIHIANPLFKTPRRVCAANGHYDPLNLTAIHDDYLPRTNYVPACDADTYSTRTPRVPWGDQKRVTEFYRLLQRGMLSQAGERTLIGAIAPHKSGHINGIQSTAFAELTALLSASFFSASIVADFFIKTTGRSNLHYTWATFPRLEPSARMTSNLLLLTCLTSHYAALWNACWNEAFRSQYWAKPDPRLDNARFSNLTCEWRWETPLRADFERRQALVEIDVLAARGLGLTLVELCTIYRIQFPVLQQNERDTWYDQCGRIVFTNSKGLPGVGFSRPEWEKIKAMSSGVVTRTVFDDTLPGGPRERVIEYVAPFDLCDREADYATAWKFFDEAGV
jgi:hypothetical protein